ncbi:MAG: hypothetical protein A2651_01440 [Candidatus Yanofskybacteria bacterium RIFCSPHIGHO2_01_FULL_42_12]|nr:MAG: hypothetical protein A2651_01440 [Candidatus Yanofskybacteria bacterium RIFCSPHIGHO2_01_FULL_42_12]
MKPWPRIGRIETITNERGRSLRRETFQSPIKKEEFIIFNSDQGTSAVVMPITEDDHVLVIKQFRAGANHVLLELPGGGKNKEDATFLETAKRELLEETGYLSEEVVPLSENEIWQEPVICTTSFYPFLALNCRYVSQPQPDSNCLEMVKIKLEEWLSIIGWGLVQDSKSLATTLIALKHIKRL